MGYNIFTFTSGSFNKRKKRGTIFSYSRHQSTLNSTTIWSYILHLFAKLTLRSYRIHIQITLPLSNYNNDSFGNNPLLRHRYIALGMASSIISIPLLISQPVPTLSPHLSYEAKKNATVQYAKELIVELPPPIEVSREPTPEATPMPITKKLPMPSAQQPVALQSDVQTTKGEYIWPAAGVVTQYPAAYHMAIDIAFRGNSQVLAARTGTVEYAACVSGGYGCHVILAHDDGFKSLYGHLREMWVAPGQAIPQGQQIGIMGATGRATGVHLHFEIRSSAGLINPLTYL